MWMFFGWEAVAQLAGDFRRPEHDLPRAMAAAFGVIAVVYVCLAAATIAVTSGSVSKVPLADLMAVGLGTAGRDATAVLAIALTMGTMNVYLSGAAKLTAALADGGALPAWLGLGAPRSVPRRPLALIAAAGTAMLAALIAGLWSTDALIRSTSACFVAVYVLALASAVRILSGTARACAAVALALTTVVAAFTSAYLLVPAGLALVALALRR
jgi:amino acid efflux transporter